MTRRPLTGFFVTDDHGSARLAKKYNVGVASTWTLLRMAVRAKLVDEDAAWGYILTLRRANRGRPSGVTDRTSFDDWVASTK